MKKWIVLALALSLLFLTACSFRSVTDIRLRFFVDGAEYRTISQYEFKNSNLSVGSKEGYRFDGWYQDAACTQAVDPTLVTSDTSLYGRWVKIEQEKTLYTVTFVVDDEIIGEQRVSSLDEIVSPAAPEKEGYVFAEWRGKPVRLQSDCTLVAYYKQLFTVRFTQDDGTLILQTEVAEGGYATPPAIPDKPETAKYKYTFVGWVSNKGDYRDVRTDMTVKSSYVSTIKQYTYVFHLNNGQEDIRDTVDYGTAIHTPTPEKEAQGLYGYRFDGWSVDSADGAIADVKEEFQLVSDFEAWAQYTPYERTFTVQFVCDDDVLHEDTVVYGHAASYEGETPRRDRTAQYTYTFDKWDASYDNITQDTVVTALFTNQTNCYDYSFVSDEGIVYSEKIGIPYGTVIETPAQDPTREAGVQYRYSFAGWDGYQEGMTVTGDAVFTAVFDEETRYYSVVFRDRSTDLGAYSVPYNTQIDYDTPYIPWYFPQEETAYVYEWQGWQADYQVKADTLFLLQRTAVSKVSDAVAVTWQYTEQQSYTAYYRSGQIVAPAQPIPREGYTLTQWQGFVANQPALQAATYVAIWQEDAEESNTEENNTDENGGEESASSDDLSAGDEQTALPSGQSAIDQSAQGVGQVEEGQDASAQTSNGDAPVLYNVDNSPAEDKELSDEVSDENNK